jgi:hypothetical protein
MLITISNTVIILSQQNVVPVSHNTIYSTYFLYRLNTYQGQHSVDIMHSLSKYSGE